MLGNSVAKPDSMECDMEMTIGTVAFGVVSQLSASGPIVALHDVEFEGSEDSSIIEVLVRSKDELKVGDTVFATFTGSSIICCWEAKKIHEI